MSTEQSSLLFHSYIHCPGHLEWPGYTCPAQAIWEQRAEKREDKQPSPIDHLLKELLEDSG